MLHALEERELKGHSSAQLRDQGFPICVLREGLGIWQEVERGDVLEQLIVTLFFDGQVNTVHDEYERGKKTDDAHHKELEMASQVSFH